MKELDKLRKKIHILHKKIDKYKERLHIVEVESYSPSGFPGFETYKQMEEKRELKEKINDLICKVYKIGKAIKTIELSSAIPIISGEVVDLYKDDKSPRGIYTVCLHNSKTIVGEVGCNEDNNVHYRIDNEYRNKGYGFQALVTMLDYLKYNNLEYITLLIHKENIFSLKLAAKLRNLFPVFDVRGLGDYISYHFDLSKRIVEEHKASRK